MIVIFVCIEKRYRANVSMQKIRLNILGLSVSQTQSGAYALVLAEEEGERRIPIIIGPVEAQAIAIQLEGLKPPRPLTHDLIKNMALAFDIALLEVTIYKLEEGIFYSELLCEMNGKEIRIDSRTSDAVALALRFRCPIYTSEEILQKAGIVLESDDENSPVRSMMDEEEPETTGSSYAQYSTSDLQELLNEAIEDEDYEKASIIRDELNKREK
ncbi:bifunctional nuclease family protein [uncultured Draconibacterium sp.]|uniref:bifunctional nuclease family protein n=2 Tax=uncultured Draconibacterium sp. TaxID=1573823 RepID=UPI0029C840BC|nr:bifunctional nuclease family protein [uncultured Draconibacterium sp.]